MKKLKQLMIMAGSGLEDLSKELEQKGILMPKVTVEEHTNEYGRVPEYQTHSVQGVEGIELVFFPRHGGVGDERIAPHELASRTKALVHESKEAEFDYVLGLTACGVSSADIPDGQLLVAGSAIFYRQTKTVDMGYENAPHNDSNVAVDPLLRERIVKALTDHKGTVTDSPFDNPFSVTYIHFPGPHYENVLELLDAKRRFIQIEGGVVLAGMTVGEESLHFLGARMSAQASYGQKNGFQGPRYGVLAVKTNPTVDLLTEPITHKHVTDTMRDHGLPNLESAIPLIAKELAGEPITGTKSLGAYLPR